MLTKTFDRVGLFMDDDGLLFLYVNTVYKHKNVLADNTFVYENDSVFCVWQNTPEDDNKVKIDLDFFVGRKRCVLSFVRKLFGKSLYR